MSGTSQATFRSFGHDPREVLTDRERTVYTLVREEYRGVLNVAGMTDESLGDVHRVLRSALWKLDKWDEDKDGPVPVLKESGDWREVVAELEQEDSR